MRENNVVSIAVVVPVYKVERTLHRCVESLLNQSVQAREIILVDDGSPDGSGDICDRYAEQYENIYVIHKENGGLGSARNAGIDIVTSEFVCFVDSDDYVKPDYLANMYAAINKSNSDIVIAGYVLKQNEDEVYCFPKDITGIYDRKNYSTFLNEFARGNAILYFAWNKLFRTKLIKNSGIRYTDRHCAEDMYFNILLYAQTKSVAVISNCDYVYIVGTQGTLSSRRRPNFWPDMKLVLETYGAVSDNYEDSSHTDLNKGNLTFVLVRNAVSNFISNEDFKMSEAKAYIEGISSDTVVREALSSSAPKGMTNRFIKVLLKFKMYRCFAIVILMKNYVKRRSFKLFAIVRERS